MGIEPNGATPIPDNDLRQSAETSAAFSGAVTTIAQPVPERNPFPGNTSGIPEDTDLARIVAAWPQLPPHLRAAMMALLATAST